MDIKRGKCPAFLLALHLLSRSRCVNWFSANETEGWFLLRAHEVIHGRLLGDTGRGAPYHILAIRAFSGILLDIASGVFFLSLFI